jgi:hypothetical protein
MHLSSRYNGEAVFLSILSGVPIEGACTFAVRVRKEFAKQVATGEPRVLSAGIVTFDHSMRSADKMLERARRALARATADGGKVVMVDPVVANVKDKEKEKEKVAKERTPTHTASVAEASMPAQTWMH